VLNFLVGFPDGFDANLRLRAELQAAHDASTLREMPEEATRAALNDLLVQVRTW
jgi:hypothetical protein